MNTRIETRFTREYGVEHPIALAPMAFVGTAPSLALAVCQAGGVGSLAAGPLPAEVVRDLIQAVKSATDRPFNVNFISILVNEAQIQTCIDERVPIVSFHWGHPPQDFIVRLHDVGIKVWEQVGSVEAAKQAVEAGVDLIVAQGSEAGGHNYGGLPTFVLVPTIRETLGSTLVLAAGGITTGRQVAAALALGADGVWIGTRFVASEEAFAHAEYKDRLLVAEGTATRLTSVYGPELPHFNPMRVLDVGLAHGFAGREDSAPKDLASQPVIGTMKLGGEQVPLRRFTSFVPTPDTEGKIDELPFLAGQGVGLIHEVLPVRQIIENLIAEAVAVLSSIQIQHQEVGRAV
jgi:NAD(P)H-dependent flavin oxidoreductase YrpB (nitropropane dioxygenase family)